MHRKLPDPVVYKLTADKSAAVSLHHEFLPMESCPISKKVVLLGDGVATISQWDGKSQFWSGWFPLPRIPKVKP